MSVVTKAVCQVPESMDTSEVAFLVAQALVPYTRRNILGGPGQVDIRLASAMPGYPMFIFSVHNEHDGDRIVHLQFGCESDYPEIGGRQALISMGATGIGPGVIRDVGASLANALGCERYFYTENDADTSDEVRPISLRDAG